MGLAEGSEPSAGVLPEPGSRWATGKIRPDKNGEHRAWLQGRKPLHKSLKA